MAKKETIIEAVEVTEAEVTMKEKVYNGVVYTSSKVVQGLVTMATVGVVHVGNEVANTAVCLRVGTELGYQASDIKNKVSVINAGNKSFRERMLSMVK